jgi:hypothetical protein
MTRFLIVFLTILIFVTCVGCEECDKENTGIISVYNNTDEEYHVKINYSGDNVIAPHSTKVYYNNPEGSTPILYFYTVFYNGHLVSMQQPSGVNVYSCEIAFDTIH